MSEATAVATPVETPVTQAQPPVESQAPLTGNTDDTAAVQPETPSAEATAEAKPDEGERLAQAARQAELDAARDEGREEGRKEILTPRQEAAQRKRLDDLRSTFGQTAQQIRANLSSLWFTDSVGEVRHMNDSEVNNLVLSLVERLHTQHFNIKAEDLVSPFQEGAFEVLKEDSRQSFSEKAERKEPKEYVREFGEAYAPQSDFTKKLNREHAKAVDEAYKAGRAKGQTDAPGEPSAGDRGNTPNFSSIRENDLASYEKRITPEQWKANDDRLKGAK